MEIGTGYKASALQADSSTIPIQPMPVHTHTVYSVAFLYHVLNGDAVDKLCLVQCFKQEEFSSFPLSHTHSHTVHHLHTPSTVCVDHTQNRVYRCSTRFPVVYCIACLTNSVSLRDGSCELYRKWSHLLLITCEWEQ